MDAARGIIQRQLRQLTRLVEDLLDVSRLAHGNIDLRRCALDLTEVVTAAVEAAWPIIEMRQHELTLDAPPRSILVDGDPVRLTQVLTNLLINAAKYTRPGGHISLTAVQEGDVATIRVRDDGRPRTAISFNNWVTQHQSGTAIDSSIYHEIFSTSVMRAVWSVQALKGQSDPWQPPVMNCSGVP